MSRCVECNGEGKWCHWSQMKSCDDKSWSINEHDTIILRVGYRYERRSA